MSSGEKLKRKTNCAKQAIPPVAAMNLMTQFAPHFDLRLFAMELSDLFGYSP
jgi:hypothetical protein